MRDVVSKVRMLMRMSSLKNPPRPILEKDVVLLSTNDAAFRNVRAF